VGEKRNFSLKKLFTLKNILFLYFTVLVVLLINAFSHSSIPATVYGTIFASLTASVITYTCLRVNLMYTSRKDLAATIPDRLEACEILVIRLESFTEAMKKDTLAFHDLFLKGNSANNDSEIKEFAVKIEEYLKEFLYKDIKKNFEEITPELKKLSSKIDAETLNKVSTFIKETQNEFKKLSETVGNLIHEKNWNSNFDMDFMNGKIIKKKNISDEEFIGKSEEIIYEFSKKTFPMLRDTCKELISHFEIKEREFESNLIAYNESSKNHASNLF
jgi:hypothetical protein